MVHPPNLVVEWGRGANMEKGRREEKGRCTGRVKSVVPFKKIRPRLGAPGGRLRRWQEELPRNSCRRSKCSGGGAAVFSHGG